MQEDIRVGESLQKTLCIFSPEVNKIKSKYLGDNITQPSFHVTTYIRRWCAKLYINREVLALSLRPETAILTCFLLALPRKTPEFYLMLDKSHLLSLFYQIFF
jgi:hypothetical protein